MFIIPFSVVSMSLRSLPHPSQLYCNSVYLPVMTLREALASQMPAFQGSGQEESQWWLPSGKGSGESRP